eukprot:m51a1_g6641 hypothetical protein (118) ;mRNA; f:110143-110648
MEDAAPLEMPAKQADMLLATMRDITRVLRTAQPAHQRSSEVLRELCDRYVRLSRSLRDTFTPRVYAPEEEETLRQERDRLAKEVVAKNNVIKRLIDELRDLQFDLASMTIQPDDAPK